MRKTEKNVLKLMGGINKCIEESLGDTNIAEQKVCGRLKMVKDHELLLNEVKQSSPWYWSSWEVGILVLFIGKII